MAYMECLGIIHFIVFNIVLWKLFILICIDSIFLTFYHNGILALSKICTHSENLLSSGRSWLSIPTKVQARHTPRIHKPAAVRLIIKNINPGMVSMKAIWLKTSRSSFKRGLAWNYLRDSAKEQLNSFIVLFCFVFVLDDAWHLFVVTSDFTAIQSCWPMSTTCEQDKTLPSFFLGRPRTALHKSQNNLRPSASGIL